MVVELIHLMRVHNKIAGLLLLASFAFEREKDFDDHQVKLA
jgi:predicted alpha/beta hydrolase family esterase